MIVTPVISPSLSNANAAVAVTLVESKLPKASFACGSGNTILGADVYLLSDLPIASNSAILPAFVFAATCPNKLDQLDPSLTIVILSLSNLPFESIPIVTTGATPVRPLTSIPLNDTAGADA